MISQELGEVPFDLRSYNIITYSTHFGEVQELQSRLTSIARGRQDGTVTFGNPVSDFVPRTAYKGVTDERQEDSEVEVATSEGGTIEEYPEEEDEEEEQGELGILDFAARAEDSISQILTTTESFSGMLVRFGERIEELGARAESENRSGQLGSAKRQRSLVRKMASEIKGFGNEIEVELPGYHEAWEDMENSFLGMFSSVPIESTEDEKQAFELITQLREFSIGVDTALEGLREVRQMLAANLGLSRDLDVAIGRAVRAMDSLIEEISTGESSVTRLTNLLEQRMPSICIIEPTADTIVNDPIHISGFGHTFEGTVHLRVRDKSNTIVANGMVTAGSTRIEPFDTELSFSQSPHGTDGFIEAYETSAKDGSEINWTSVSIKFR